MTTAPSKSRIPATALLPYLLIVFSIAWGLIGLYIFLPEAMTARFGELGASHPGFILAVWSPAIAAFSIVAYYRGLPGLRAFLSRLLLWRCPAAWYAYLLVGFPLVFIAGSAIKGNLLAEPLPFDSATALLAAMAFMFVLGPMEEFGWRGLALPLLQRRLVPFWAGLVLGLVWATWHLPAFFLSGTPQSAWEFTPFFIGSVCLSIILTPFFNAAGGSILVAMLYHFQANNPVWPDAQPFDSYILVAVAVVVVWLNRRTMFAHGEAVTDVIPPTERSGSGPLATSP